MIQDLVDIGHDLYESLFPEGSTSFKQEYARFREKYRGKGKGLVITSDDPWIPWAMLRPYQADDDGNVIYDDPALGECSRSCAGWPAAARPIR